MKRCVLEDKICTDCGACDDRCQLDPTKYCDNCFKCLETGEQAYLDIPISGVYLPDEYLSEEGYQQTRYTHTQTLPGMYGERPLHRRKARTRW